MPAGLHDHCSGCYDVHCRAPPRISLSCPVVRCGNGCGAALHMCKEDEHRLLCPDETVPCLNAGYGCPLAMPRRGRARHLQACPASVVGCSQEWNRWPASDADLEFCGKVSGRVLNVQLDAALAFRDQELLFRSIKMREVFPELTQDPNPRGAEAARSPDEGEAAGCSPGGSCAGGGAPARSGEVVDVQNKKVLRKETGGGERREEAERRVGSRRGASEEREPTPSCTGGESGLAPWQDGVLERLGREVDIGEYNMYLVHNGAMLIDFGQLAACTPRDKDFVYGGLEPIEVKSVRTFRVPTSYRAKRNHLKDPNRKASVRHRGVDTADLGAAATPSDEVSATLLCCLEKELKGHLISEGGGADGFYVDVGTQTYGFASAPFPADASLADVVAGRPADLRVHVEAEAVTRRHNKTSSAFTRTCGLFLRRDEFHAHSRNVHADIQAGLGGWFLQRCPLAYRGCTFAQTRFRPRGQPAAVEYNRSVGAFVVRPLVPPSLRPEGSLPDPLSDLPPELLRHIAGFLDGPALSQLSRVSRLMRGVCATLLHRRGMVSLRWEKKSYSHGGSSWRCRKKVWEFSSCFSCVDGWTFEDAPPMSEHLKTCVFYEKEERSEPVALSCLAEAAGGRR